MTTPASSLRLGIKGTDEQLHLRPSRLVVAGFTGRDDARVAAHIAELTAAGVPLPPSVPAFYPLDPALLSTAASIGVAGDQTSGEVEPVVIASQGRYYLGVGSDHTDRAVERLSIPASKQACPKPVAAEVVRLPDELDLFGWDEVLIESRVDHDLCQTGSLAELRRPEDLLARLPGPQSSEGDLVVFGGTIPLVSPGFRFGRHWQVTLTLPGDIVIRHSYQVRQEATSCVPAPTT